MVHNLVYESHLQHGETALRERLRSEARATLREVTCRHPKKVFSAEFREGFVDGYSDYLDKGGPAVPPSLAPAKYRKPSYLTPEGHRLVHDYFMGFKYGIDLAVLSGQRPLYTVPVLVTEELKPAPPPISAVPFPPPPEGLSTDPEPTPTPAVPAAPMVPPAPAAPQVPSAPSSKVPMKSEPASTTMPEILRTSAGTVIRPLDLDALPKPQPVEAPVRIKP